MRLLWIVILFLTGKLLFAQQLYFSNYPLFIDQQRRPVQLIEQDNNGMIWVASESRLFRFNGIDFNEVVLINGDVGRINSISNIGMGKESLWLGTDSGKLISNNSGEFRIVDSISFSGNPISGIERTASDEMWVSTYGGGLYFRIGTGEFAKVAGLNSSDIYDMDSGEGKVWLATDDGLTVCEYKDGKVEVVGYSRDHGIPDKIVKSVKHSTEGVFIGTHEAGVAMWNPAFEKFEVLTDSWDSGAIRLIEIVEDKEVWVVTERREVLSLQLEGNDLNVLRDQNRNPFRQVKDLMFDREGNIWLCSEVDGVFRGFRKFEFYQSPVSNVQAVQPVSPNTVLIGTSSGLYRFNLKDYSAEQVEGSTGLNIIAIHRIGTHYLIGTFDRGAWQYSLNAPYPNLGPVSGLQGHSVITINHSSDQIWFSTLSGLLHTEYHLSGNKLNIDKTKKLEHLVRNYVYDIYVESDTSIFFATDGHGVAHLEHDNITYLVRDTINNLQVYSITKGVYGKYYIVENSLGLCTLIPDSNMINCNNLSANVDITAIATDYDSNIVAVHGGGLDIINEHTLNSITYGNEFGFEGLTSQLNSISDLDSGDLFVASQSGVIKIRKTENAIQQPIVNFEYIRAGNRVLPANEHAELKPDENTIQFGLEGLFYTNPESVKFAYKLEGHDDGWKITRDKSVVYSKLDPGPYEFKVRVTSELTAGKDSLTSFSFNIEPPLTQRWWFIFLVCTLLIVLGVAIVRWRERSVARKKELQAAIIERQYEVLKNQLNPHFLFNAFNTLAGYIEEDPKTAVVVVEKLTSFYRKILEVREYKLVSLNEELELLYDYVYLLNKRFDNNLHLEVAMKSTSGYIPPMTFQILVENAVKHNVLSGTHPLTVRIEETDSKTIRVVNNIKPKRNVVQSTGIGLKNIDKRYRLLGFDPIRTIRTDMSFTVVLPKILNGDK